MTHKHSPLSPSGAVTWINCPGSVRMQRDLVEQPTKFATEGDMAHDLAQQLLASTAVQYCFMEGLSTVSVEMMDYVNQYAKLVRKELRNGQLLVEHRVNYSDYVPDGYGYVDVAIIGRKRIKIIDFKYGKGIWVDIHNNYQLLLYALGVYVEYSWIMDIKKIDLLVCQPRMNNWGKITVSPAYLMKFAEWVSVKAEETQAENAPLVPGVAQCQWCRAKHGCPARAETALQLAQIRSSSVELPAANKIPLEHLAYIIDRLPEFKKWAKDIEQYAYVQALDGNVIPDHKLVEGKRRRVLLTNAATILVDYIPQGVLYKPPEMLGITAIEQQLTLAQRKEIMPQITRSIPGKPTLVSSDDKRAEWTSGTAESLDDEFGSPEGEE